MRGHETGGTRTLALRLTAGPPRWRLQTRRLREAVRGDETGSALLVAVAAGALVSALAAALAATVMIEDAVEANHRRGVQALYAADGLLASVVADIAVEADWGAIEDGSVPGRFGVGPAAVTLPDGLVVDAEAEAAVLPRDGAGNSGLRWRLFAWGWLGDLIGAPDDGAPRFFLAAWVRAAPTGTDPGRPAEPPSPVPSDPGQDGVESQRPDGRLVVRSAAFGPFRVRREVEATVARESGAVRVVAWNVVR